MEEREVGLVKWYGGYNSRTNTDNDYGFISREGKSDLWIPGANLLCRSSELRENTLVSFLVGIGREDREVARQLRLVSTEDETSLLSKCFHSSSYHYWLNIAETYLRRLSIEAALEEALAKFKTLSAENQRMLANKIPRNVLIHEDASLIGDKLPHAVLFEVLLARLEERFNTSKYDAVVTQIINFIASSKEADRLKFFPGLPSNLIQDSRMFPYLDVSRKYQILLDELHSRSMDEVNNQISLLIEVLREGTKAQQKAFMLKLPDHIRENPLLIEFIDPVERFHLYLEQLKSTAHEGLALLEDKAVFAFMDIENEDRIKIESELPQELYQHPMLFTYISPQRHIKLLLENIENKDLDSDSYLYLISSLAGILSVLAQSQRISIIEDLPLVIRNHPAIASFLPAEKQMENFLLDNPEPEDRELFVANFAALHTMTETPLPRPSSPQDLGNKLPVLEYLPLIPKHLKTDVELVDIYNPIQLVEVVWELLINGDNLEQYWKHLSIEAKTLMIYRIAYEDSDVDVSQLDEANAIVGSLLNLIWVKKNPKHKNTTFQRLHQRLQDYIVEIAWDISKPITLPYLLPNCVNNVKPYCEGKVWQTEEEKSGSSQGFSRAYCPSIRTSCQVLQDNNYIQEINQNILWGARFFPIPSLPWYRWSLLELLNYAGVTPTGIENLSNPIEYLTKFSGWINRLNDIRQRLKCSVCHTTMIPNMKYSKEITASHNMTIASCPHKEKGHDHNVYFNHCWSCQEIIDSRQNIVQVEGLYLCLKCGSGPRKSAHYKQGTICPKCGSKNMERANDGMYRCKTCSHSIKIPPPNHLTGS